MKRPSLRVLVPMVAAVAFSLVSSTSYAMYRVAMGPKQCCKSHCRRGDVPPQAAERCCRTHLHVVPAASAPSPAHDTGLPAHVAVYATPLALAPSLAVFSVSILEGRAPPGLPLLAQRVSLLV